MRILIADRQALLRDALRILLEGRGHRVVADAASEHDACALAVEHTPDLALIDLEGAPFEMLAAAGRIASELPRTAVVLLAGVGEDDLFLDALSCGARGFVTRNMDEQHFCTLLERAASGEIVVAPEFASRLLDLYARTAVGAPPGRRAMMLTQREHEVLTHMTRGQTSNRALAQALGLSENTIRFHVRNILEKFHVHSRAAVVAYAYSHDVVKATDDRGESPQ